jgi:hypothetical protein
MKGLINTLNLLEKLQEEFEKVVEEGPGEFFVYLGINYLYLTIKRIVSKTNRKARDEIVRL